MSNKLKEKKHESRLLTTEIKNSRNRSNPTGMDQGTPPDPTSDNLITNSRIISHFASIYHYIHERQKQKQKGQKNIMENISNQKYSVQLSFEEIRLPPFEDILILGKKYPQGKIGITKSFDFLVPNEFDVFPVDSQAIEAVFINKRILRKMDSERIIKILFEKVFPFVSENELIKVDFKLRIFYDTIEGDFQ